MKDARSSQPARPEETGRDWFSWTLSIRTSSMKSNIFQRASEPISLRHACDPAQYARQLSETYWTIRSSGAYSDPARTHAANHYIRSRFGARPVEAGGNQ